MPLLDTWGFIKKLTGHTMRGDPLAILEDIHESQADAKKEADKDAAIEAEGEGSDHE